MRHINFFFLGAQNGVFWGGGQKVSVEKVYVLFLRSSKQFVFYTFAEVCLPVAGSHLGCPMHDPFLI